MNFFARLQARSEEINSLLCVGLDPHVSQLNSPTADAAEAFCINIIQATSQVAVAYKPNAAFFEAFGAEGIRALQNVIQSIPDNIPVLLDAKRGDISTTAAAYATSAFEIFRADAITLAPYMGRDSIDPFSQDPVKGCFVLCKTSNSSSGDLQTLKCTSQGTLLYEKVALLAQTWNQNNNIGLVVGATDIEALRRVRSIVPDMWILAPGIGAQGGDLQEAVATGTTKAGTGLLVPVSRGISKAENPGQAAKDLRDAINAARCAKKAATSIVSTTQDDFIQFALSLDVLRFGEFTLKSGRTSPYFFNAGLFNSGRALAKLGRFYAQAIHDSGLEYDVLFGPAYKGITLVAAIAIAYAEMYDTDIPYAYNRKEAKDHGEGGVLVGASMNGKRVLIVDDVITAGTAIGEAMAILKQAQAIPSGVCISLDRQEKVSTDGEARSAIQMVQEKYGIQVISIATLNGLVEFLEKNEDAAEAQARIKAYRKEYGV